MSLSGCCVDETNTRVSDTVIKVESLSKKYLLSHQKGERYTALRDVITRGAAKLGRRLVSPLTHSAPATPDNRTEEFFALKDVSFGVPTRIHPELTGRENIYLNGAILGMSRAEIKRKFDEIVAFAVAAHLRAYAECVRVYALCVSPLPS